MWEIKGKDNQTKATVYALEYNGEWMGESYVSVTIESPSPIAFAIGDYLMYRGERFEINYDPGKIKSAPQFVKGDAFKYENIKFNSLADELTRCSFLDVVSGDNGLHFSGLSKFSFYGNAMSLASRIQANLDRAYPGKWTVKTFPQQMGSKQLNVSINAQTVWNALSILVNNFETHFTISDRTINVGAIGLPVNHLFKYGKGNGLYELEQNAEADQAIVTRLRAYGSTRNIPHRYYNSLSGADGQKLIPDNMAVQNLMLPEFPYTTLDPYIDSANKEALGIREGSIFFDGTQEGLEEIYPSIDGMTAEQLKAAGVPCNSTGALDVLVSAEQMTDDGVGDINEGETETTATPPTFKVTLKDLGFNINDHLTTETATISFKTGMLGGREFEIVGCEAIKDSTDKVTGYKLELNRVYDDGIKLWFPYKDYNAKPGDKFVLLHIEMPEVYIKAAAQRLLEAATAWLAKNDYSRSVYAPKVDEIFMARQHDEAMASGGSIVSLHDTLKEGMLLLFEDEDLNIDASIFIDRLTIKEGDGPVPTYEVVLKEEKTVGRLDKMQNQIDSLAAGGGQGGGYSASQIRSLIEAYGGSRFLSKVKDDRSKGRIASDLGFEVGKYLAGASGGMFGIDSDSGESFADVFRLFVRGKAYFETLTIIEAKSLAGKQYITPGGSIKCARVAQKGLIEVTLQRPVTDEEGNPVIDDNGKPVMEEYTEMVDNGVPEGVYRCYFLSEQDGEKTETKIIAGDQAISEMFNAKTGTANKVSNHRYWRLVTAVNNDAYTDESGNHYGYIELSATDCENGSDTPKEGDAIDQFGNRSDPARQAAMVFDTVGPDAPSIKMYGGINSYTLNDRAIISFGRDPLNNKVYFRLGLPGASQYLDYKQGDGLTLAGKLSVNSTIDGKTLNDYFTGLIPELSQDDVEGFVNAIVDPKLEGIQNQIDGVIETWFYNGVPTLTNYPASGWNTPDLKIQHLGDLYYDNDTGTAYRFSQNAQGAYYWNTITDDAITKALAAAQKAQETANSKHRTFTAQPVPPYDKGDLWVNATYGTQYSNDILRCITAKASGAAFAIGDWTLASKYTDDTLAQAAKDAADAAQNAADAAKGVADAAKDRLDNWAADGVISPTEKQAIRDEMVRIAADKAHIDSEFARYGLTDNEIHTAYKDCYNTYLGQLQALASTAQENNTIPSDFENNQTAYYYARTLSLALIAAEAKKYAEEVAKQEAQNAVAGYEYLKNALPQDTQIIGGLLMSTLISLGYTDAGNVRHTMAGMNGAWVDTLGGRTIGSWWGGPMVDLFDANDAKKNLAAGTYATSMLRMDGSAYFAGGNAGFRSDGSGWFGSGDSIITFANGGMTFGSGVTFNVANVSGLKTTLDSLANFNLGLSELLVPCDANDSEISWQEASQTDTVNGGIKAKSLKAKVDFWSTGGISALGKSAGGSGGSGGGSFGLMKVWPTTDPGSGTTDALGANLGWELRQDVLSLKSGSALSVVTAGSGNAITDIVKSGTTVTATKGATFLTQHQPLDYLNIKDVRDAVRPPTYFDAFRMSAWFNATGMPTSAWYSGINIKGWSDDYASWQLAANSTNNTNDKNLYFRVGINSTWESWQKVLTDANYSSVLNGKFVTLDTAQTISGAKTFSSAVTAYQIQSAGRSAVWINGRSASILRTTSSLGYTPLWSAKSDNGSWDCGTYSSDVLHFSYITDTNYSAGTNIQTADIQFTTSGQIVAKGFKRSDGTASQFLKADGSVDGNSYALASALGNYYTKAESDGRFARLQTPNNLVHSSNEITMIPNGFSSNLWLNHKAVGGTGHIRDYYMGDGNTGVAGVVAKGFVKHGSSDSYLLLGGGGHKALTDITNAYVKKSGDTMTGILCLGSSAAHVYADHTYGAWLQYGDQYINVKSDGLWHNNTYKIWDSGNMGPGSNLNADMVDGKHYAQIASGGHASYTFAGTAAPRWVRIAKSGGVEGVNVYYSYGIISITHAYYNNTTQGVTLAVHTGYRSGSTNHIAQLGGHGGQLWKKARIVYPTASDSPYYLEVYMDTSSVSEPVYIEMTGSFNMELLGSYTEGSVPSGYATKELDLTTGLSAEAIKATTFTGALSGNATSATKLATARTINGTNFDGTANIVTSYWGATRTLWGQSCNGSGNVSGDMTGVGTIRATGGTYRFLANYNTSPYGLRIWTSSNGDVSFQAEREANIAEVFRLLLNPNGGNVGIGTTSPAYKLDVSGQIRANVATGTAPFVTPSTTVCTNLNADLLDGLHSSSFPIRKDAPCNTTSIYDLRNNFGSYDRNDYSSGQYYGEYPSPYGVYLSLVPRDRNCAAMLFIDSGHSSAAVDKQHVFVNTRNAGDNSTAFNGWQKLAYVTDNVASATKLADNTAVKAWGQTFFENGKPKAVSGALTGVTDITASGDIKAKRLSLNNGTSYIEWDAANNAYKVNGNFYATGGSSCLGFNYLSATEVSVGTLNADIVKGDTLAIGGYGLIMASDDVLGIAHGGGGNIAFGTTIQAIEGIIFGSSQYSIDEVGNAALRTVKASTSMTINNAVFTVSGNEIYVTIGSTRYKLTKTTA